MKQALLLFLLLSALVLTACAAPAPAETMPPETTAAPTEAPETVIPTTLETIPPKTTEAMETTVPLPLLELTEQEQTMLLKLAMAERGATGCLECTALVMRTVLNRVEAENRFGSSISSVILAPEQFTPVMDGSYDTAQSNELCQEALELVLTGWDESQGALFYEWCEGESWHSQNLHLLFQHCDTRFYD